MTLDVGFRGWTGAIASTAALWQAEGLIRRLWEKDPTVWFDPPRPEIDNRLGWLDLPTTSTDLVGRIGALADEAIASGITDLVLLRQAAVR